MQPDRTFLHVVDSLHGGGAEGMLVDLLHALCGREGWSTRHQVVTLRQAGRLASRLPPRVACHAIGASGPSRWTGWRLARIARRVRAGLLHARGVGCWADAVVAKMVNPRMSLVLGFHGRTDGLPFSRRERFVARVAGRLGARFATVGEAGAARLLELGVAADRIDRLINGVDAARFAPDASLRDTHRRAWGWRDNEFVIGSVGSLTPVKRHDLLLHAFGQLMTQRPSVRLVLVGDGALRQQLESLVAARKLSESVTFTGYREDIPGLLCCMDAYVCASDSECMSNAVLQALAAGLPTIVTAVGDNPRVVRHGLDGLVVPAGSSPELVSALESLIDQPRLRANLAEASRRRVVDFSFRDTAARYDRYYEALSDPS